MDPLIGRRLDGRYHITELIGVGGMANVYKATDLMENRVVAVKVLRDEFLDNDELVRRFKNESKAIGLLSHPNIVRVFDVNFSDAVQYIVMEFIDGITLKQYIDAVKPLSWKDTVHFTVQILRALQHAHDRGIVHRDIKPQNIMLIEDGSIKVMDFGIARFSRSETRTITDKAIGSVHYISPEQAKGDITDAKADLYSVGIMMYEMQTGKLPFESDTPVQVAIKQISDEATRPREIVPDIPEGLEEITLKAMAKDPTRRYQSASQMLRDIDDFKKNPSIVFEYKYFSDPAPTRYVDKAAYPGGNTDISPRQTVPPKKKTKKRKISNYLIYGITAACVVCTVVLALFLTGQFDGRHEDVELPNFVGMQYDDILTNEAYSKFVFIKSEESDYHPTVPIGEVYDQNPLPGKTVKDNSTITLFVSLGAKEVSLPDVVGMTSSEAKITLTNLGLTVKQEKITDENYDANIVIRMSPEANSVVASDTTVTIYVNVLQGSGGVSEVPQLVGSTYTDALKKLMSNNLMRGAITYEASTEPEGTVLRQSLPEGTKVPANTKIDLVISEGIKTASYTLEIPLPNGPVGADGNVSAYNVVITVNGEQVTSRNGVKSSGYWNVTVTVDKDASVIKVWLNNNDYLTYTAYVSETRCEHTGGTAATDWPFAVPAGASERGAEVVPLQAALPHRRETLDHLPRRR